jgi:signal transduction histidine kinase
MTSDPTTIDAPLDGSAPRQSRRVFSIGRKLGVIFAMHVVMLAAVCAMVVHHLGRMGEDSSKLVEETRESSLAAELLTAVAGIQILAPMRDVPADRMAESLGDRLTALFAVAQRSFQGLRHGPPEGDDPSTPEHEAREQEIFARIADGLAAAQQWLARSDAADAASLPARLAQVYRDAETLSDEMRAEWSAEQTDLMRRGNAARRIMWITLLATVAGLCGTLWLVLHGIVRPIRVLAVRAEDFGAGRFERRITIRTRDELGDLATVFNRMAERLQKTHSQLEELVATRTRKFIRAAKLADLGTLAAGVAHEINTPLASIASCAEGLQRRLANGIVDTNEQADYLQTIAAEAYRAHGITASLLALARQDASPMAEVELRAVLRQVQMMVRHQFEERRIRLEVDVPDDLPIVRGSAPELTQVLMNLLLNARDASPQGGTVRLRCHATPAALIVEVEDRGAGIPEPMLERVFDPFFTTKAPGKGTGLGLALALAIVEGHGGTLRAENSVPCGARFRMTLPLPEERAS